MAALVEVNTTGKKVSRYVSGSNDSVLLAAKWDYFAATNAAGDPVTAATIQQQATGLLFTVNGGAEVVLGTYTGNSGADNEVVYADTNANSVKETIDIINGVAPGQPDPGDSGYMVRWRAGLGDFRPGWALGATSGLAVGATNALTGRRDLGLLIKGNSSGLETANTLAAAVGTGLTREGKGQRIPDHFQSDYVTDTSGNRFPVRDARRRQEEQPGHARYSVYLTEILAAAGYANSDKVATVYDIDDNIVAAYAMGSKSSVEQISELNPLVGPPGSPLFVEISGTGAFTNGPVSVTGEIRIA